MTSPHDLSRFIEAQARHYPQALAELRAGAKRTHWMWFVFPQIAGLGSSETARYYAIASIAEAREYLAHPVLGPRLAEVAAALFGTTGNAIAILGQVDAIKLRSSMTLFAEAADDPSPFRTVIDRFFDGDPDPATLARL